MGNHNASKSSNTPSVFGGTFVVLTRMPELIAVVNGEVLDLLDKRDVSRSG